MSDVDLGQFPDAILGDFLRCGSSAHRIDLYFTCPSNQTTSRHRVGLEICALSIDTSANQFHRIYLAGCTKRTGWRKQIRTKPKENRSLLNQKYALAILLQPLHCCFRLHHSDAMPQSPNSLIFLQLISSLRNLMHNPG